MRKASWLAMIVTTVVLATGCTDMWMNSCKNMCVNGVKSYTEMGSKRDCVCNQTGDICGNQERGIER
jgi:hypothetical protein